jgi:hypothetical protein
MYDFVFLFDLLIAACYTGMQVVHMILSIPLFFTKKQNFCLKLIQFKRNLCCGMFFPKSEESLK